MNDLDLMVAKYNIIRTKTKIEASVIEIKQNNPHRTDLISSMNKSIDELQESLLKWVYIEKQCRAYSMLNNSLTHTNLILLQENKDLKMKLGNVDENESYIRNLELENEALKNKLKILLDEI